jgi:hypothetical protein
MSGFQSATIRRSDDREPRVGIFWMLPKGKFLFDSTPLRNALPHGGYLTHPRGHIDYWQLLQQKGAIEWGMEYEEFPRGRICYSPKEEKFFLYSDRCILARPSAIRKIVAIMRLPRDAFETSIDSHYRCSKCLLKFSI